MTLFSPTADQHSNPVHGAMSSSGEAPAATTPAGVLKRDGEYTCTNDVDSFSQYLE